MSITDEQLEENRQRVNKLAQGLIDQNYYDQDTLAQIAIHLARMNNAVWIDPSGSIRIEGRKQ